MAGNVPRPIAVAVRQTALSSTRMCKHTSSRGSSCKSQSWIASPGCASAGRSVLRPICVGDVSNGESGNQRLSTCLALVCGLDIPAGGWARLSQGAMARAPHSVPESRYYQPIASLHFAPPGLPAFDFRGILFTFANSRRIGAVSHTSPSCSRFASSSLLHFQTHGLHRNSRGEE